MSCNQPIGVFDSGVGGLSLLREIRAELPQEDLVYLADSAYAPYGTRSADWIIRRSVAVTTFLLQQGSKAIVIACNTATAAAVAVLREQFSIPIVAIEPAIKPAIAESKSGAIGVLATPATLASDKFAQLLVRFGRHARIIPQACPGLAEIVEGGELSSAMAKELVASYVEPLIKEGVDVLVLGCTHYPFLDDLIRSVGGPSVKLIDPARAVSRELRRRLRLSNLVSASSSAGLESFWTSGGVDQVQELTRRLWRQNVVMRRLPPL